MKLDMSSFKREIAKEQSATKKAAIRAIDRVATTARKAGDQALRERVTLKSSDVKGAITIAKPFGRTTLIRDIQAKGKPIPLRAYAARRTRKGVTFAVIKGHRKPYRAKGNAAFIVDRLGQHVFARTGPNPPGPKGAPITKIHGPSIVRMFGTRAVLSRVISTINERWSIEFEREFAHATKR